MGKALAHPAPVLMRALDLGPAAGEPQSQSAMPEEEALCCLLAAPIQTLGLVGMAGMTWMFGGGGGAGPPSPTAKMNAPPNSRCTTYHLICEARWAIPAQRSQGP
ncbi:UNVERIFIED_CONTAM: hypothetical protein K2H54_060274 [Gekko kuhli]